MIRALLMAAATALIAGCATPLPDGSKIDRLPDAALAQPPALSAQEKKRLEQQNAQILAEQDAAREREDRIEAARRAYPPAYWSLHYGHPGWYPHYGWWSGHDWSRRPRWSWGVGIGGPFPY
jgi:hypothetical protein